MSNDDLNNLTHLVADFISDKTGEDLDIEDKYEINDALTALLQHLGITFTEDDDE